MLIKEESNDSSARGRTPMQTSEAKLKQFNEFVYIKTYKRLTNTFQSKMGI